MPGFATSEGTKANAWKLMNALGVTGEEIDIRPAARQMLADMGHPFAEGEPVYDVTFENVQAGLRTDYLFRLANQRKGFVIGTGDLSELALGWCTYGVGDQMSHYGVNAGVPKTLIQYLIRWCVASDQFDPATDAVLEAILATEISPELVPAGADGAIQSTESRIGPYELHDFFLHHTIRYGQRPSKVAFLAWHAWHDAGRRPLADRLPGGGAAAVRPADDREVARDLPLALLRLRPVQALGAAERAEGLRRRRPVAARRLAGAVGRDGRPVARRAPAKPARSLISWRRPRGRAQTRRSRITTSMRLSSAPSGRRGGPARTTASFGASVSRPSSSQ